MTQTPEGVRGAFWADEEASHLPPDRKHVIRDSKTPSGSVPISGLRGPIITDALYRTFKKRGLDVRYVFTIDDYDPMDSASMKQKAGMAEQMGKPLCAIPSPDPSASDFARYHAERYLATFADLGIRPQEVHWMRELYRSGQLDKQIDLAIRNAATIREIYERVANVRHSDRWLPVAVICENCGRLGTTEAFDYDGKTVAYECKPNFVEWAEGCGHTGRRSPFKGGAKLYWNLQWCAMWDHFSVTYEEGGKDLLTEGGSRDRSNEIYRVVWKKEPPLGLIHEFLNIGGKKMSTSRPEEWQALGAEAHEFAKIYPPELIRFLMLRTPPHRHIDFDPGGDRLPRLYDEYDRCADAYLTDAGSDFAKVWSLSQIDEEHGLPPAFRVRFSLVATWLQIPSSNSPLRRTDPVQQATLRKGAPLTPAELAELMRRVALAKIWLERWAPEEAKFQILDQLPADILFTDKQKTYFVEVKKLVGRVTDPEEMHQQLYEAAKRVGIMEGGKVSRDAFSALYLAFLGKRDGPRAAWLITEQDPAFVRGRLEAASR